MTSNSKMAVAAAVLQHLLEVIKCKTLFITHYPLVATELEKKFPSEVQNVHVGYTAETRIDGKREMTFLYRLAPGAAAESFGIECARLAGIPEVILEGARNQSTSMNVQVEQRLRKKRSINFFDTSIKLISCPGLRNVHACCVIVLKSHGNHGRSSQTLTCCSRACT
jgi:DNA mismatch repair ATPase MutS